MEKCLQRQLAGVLLYIMHHSQGVWGLQQHPATRPLSPLIRFLKRLHCNKFDIFIKRPDPAINFMNLLTIGHNCPKNIYMKSKQLIRKLKKLGVEFTKNRGKGGHQLAKFKGKQTTVPANPW